MTFPVGDHRRAAKALSRSAVIHILLCLVQQSNLVAGRNPRIWPVFVEDLLMASEHNMRKHYAIGSMPRGVIFTARAVLHKSIFPGGFELLI